MQDFYRPWRERRGALAAERHYVQAGRAGMGVIGVAMFAMAVASFYWQRYSEMGLLEQEHLRVILLNTKNQIMGIPEVYKGSVNTSMVRVSEIFRDAIRENCPAIVVVHNHPSGDPTPSSQDVEVTSQLVEAGKLLDIDVLDHIVIGHSGDGGFVSLKEQGLGF